ncbi:hypothetical protein Tco_1149572, partial [Tanacetum coccineum]
MLASRVDFTGHFHHYLVKMLNILHQGVEESASAVHEVHERTMQTHKGMINKDASKIDNNVAGASHDKDNITK